MTVTKTASQSTSSSHTNWIHFSGTIQEVLDALSSESFSALNVSYYTDDGTDAVAVGCRQR